MGDEQLDLETQAEKEDKPCVFGGSRHGSKTRRAARVTAQSLRAEKLAAKWGYVWLRKVFPDGTAWQRSHSETGGCPVRKIYLHGDQEANEVFTPCDLLQLEAGSPLLTTASIPLSHNPVFATPLHPCFPKDCWYLPAQIQHWSNNQDDYMTLSFTRPTRVFILLPSLGSDPRWLRASFFKLRDPNFQEVHLKVKWKVVFAQRFMLGMAGVLDSWRAQTIRVFKSKQVYHPGEQCVIGGMGLGAITDVGFMVAFRQDDLVVDRSTSALYKDANPTHFSMREMVDLESWLQQLIKVVKKGRIVEARLLIETDLARPPELSHLAQHDINVLPEGESELLLVDLAAATRDFKMIALLVDRCKCVLSYKALQCLVRHWEEVPALSGTALGLMLQYLTRHPNPLAIVSAFLMALRMEMRMRFRVRPTTQLEEAAAKLQELQLLLLRRSQDAVRDSSAEHHLKVQQLEAILDPKYGHLANGSAKGAPRNAIMTVSCFKPLRVAMHDGDAEFMESSVVEQFNRFVWQGREFCLETCKEGQYILSLLDPSMIYVILMGCGFAHNQMKGLDLSARLWHLGTYASQAYYNSPRCRWLLRLFASVMFIILYMQVIGSDLIPTWYAVDAAEAPAEGLKITVTHQTVNVALFNCWILGNVVELLQIIYLRQRNMPLKYFTAHPLQAFFFVVDLFMICLSSMYAYAINVENSFELYTLQVMTMCWASAAPLLWGQALLPLIPLLDQLGPMLGTLRAMMSQVAVFIIPWALITAGFSVSLTVVYSPLAIPQLDTFWSTMFILFRGYANGGPDPEILSALDDYEGIMQPELLSAFRLYGDLVFVAYTVISTIILGNLLIAIITNSYKPDKVRAQSKLSFAEYVEIHQFQVENHLLCSPFNLVPLMFFYLPSGKRQKVHPTVFYRKALAFLDGFVPATPSNPDLPIGRAEIPHLIYLFIIPPVCWMFSTALFVLHLPISVFYFASKGHYQVVRMVKSLTSSFSGSNPTLSKPSFTTSLSAGSVSGVMGNVSTRSSLSGSLERSNNTVTASNDEFGVFGPSASESSEESSKGLMKRLLDAAWLSIRFCGWLFTGAMVAMMFGLVTFVVWPLFNWVAAVLWSLFHILGGSFKIWYCTIRSGLRGGDNTVCPAISGSSAMDTDFEERHMERVNIIREQEERYKKYSLFTHVDIRECLEQVFGDAYRPATPARGLQSADEERPASTRWKRAGAMSTNITRLAGGRGKAPGVVAAINKAFGKKEAADGGKPGGKHTEDRKSGSQGLADVEEFKQEDKGDKDDSGDGPSRGLSAVLESLGAARAQADKQSRASGELSSTGRPKSALKGDSAQSSFFQAHPVVSLIEGHTAGNGHGSSADAGRQDVRSQQSEIQELKGVVLEMQAKLQDVTRLLTSLAAAHGLPGSVQVPGRAEPAQLLGD